MFRLDYLLSWQSMLIFVCLIFIASAIVALKLKPDTFLKSRINVFVSILASVAVLLIGISLIISAATLETTEENTHMMITKTAIDKLWLYPNELLTKSTSANPDFLRSFYYNNPRLNALKTKEASIDTSQSVLQEQFIAIVMIQAWEDYLTLRKFDSTGDRVWLNNFIQWAQSPFLKDYFENLKYNFKDTTIELGDILFEYGQSLPIPTTNPEIYKNTIDQMLKDEKLIKLFEKFGRD
ncbi:MAG: hypothetical protein JHC93_01850 [Parachlamydiales bacterium]|nr:hypothetical protein [Parachlamydiales bacterium]